uniref:Fibronectin type-III domain-containing protein n=1 Tax=Panagrolaimus sp. PS1159 TaxID=55785 RepID=A0AC35FXI2_9BILA
MLDCVQVLPVVTNLDTLSEYQFRVVAANSSGFGPPSNSTPPIQLRAKYDLPPKNGNFPPPINPTIVSIEGDRCTLEWQPAPNSRSGAPISGYNIEYRTPESPDWILSNDYPVSGYRYEVTNLRPNGEYEFRVTARYIDGTLSDPSYPTGFVKIKPTVPMRSHHNFNPNLVPPGQPQVMETDSTWVQLHWVTSPSADHTNVSYIVEMREIEIGDPTWYTATTTPIVVNELIIENLHSDSTYEFRVSTVGPDGSQSAPSETSDIIRLRPIMRAGMKGRTVPERPAAPEYLDFNGGSSVTLCWMPANSILPVEGYEVEFRDFQQDATQWFKVTDKLVYSCKTTVGYLINGHQYQFRIIAKNAIGYSEPSDASPPITIGKAILQRNASGYLQHLTYNDNVIKEETRSLGGIPLLIRLLDSEQSEIQRNACGCLKNLAFGKENDENKKVIMECNGVRALSNVIKNTPESHVKEEASGALWNISSCDELKEPVLNQVADTIVNTIVIPGSGWSQNDTVTTKQTPQQNGKSFGLNVFRNGTGILRNVSAANAQARHLLRKSPNLIESLLHYLNSAINRNQVDTRAVENVVCILRNLSYRVEEVVNPKYNPNDKHVRIHGKKERSKSAPSDSPKGKKKGGLFKKSKKGKENVDSNVATVGPPLLWHPDTVKTYLKLLQESSNSDTLEASAAAIQNLAACQFDGSVQVRQTVRQEKGLSILTELLKVQDEKVLTAVATALRNLVLDQANCELIGKNALPSLIDKLPRPDEQQRNPKVSDATISAILGIFFEIVKSNAHLTRSFHESGGTPRLMKLAQSCPPYGKKVCKYATQVLYMMWQHKELHDGFRRSGFKEADFYSGSSSARSRDATTLARPISSQGAERPVHLQSENLDDSGESAAAYGHIGGRNDLQQLTPNSDRSGGSGHYQRSTNATPSQQHYQIPGEPLYASVNKRNIDHRRGSIGGDSWV